MFKNKKNEKTKNINNDKIKEQKNVLMDEGEKKERKIMKRIALVCALVAVVGGSFYGGMSYGRLLPASHRYYSNSQVYATVGDTDITGKDIKSVMEPIFYANGLQKLTESQISTYESTMLEYLVNIEVLYKEAKELEQEAAENCQNAKCAYEKAENYNAQAKYLYNQTLKYEQKTLECYKDAEEKIKEMGSKSKKCEDLINKCNSKLNNCMTSCVQPEQTKKSCGCNIYDKKPVNNCGCTSKAETYGCQSCEEEIIQVAPEQQQNTTQSNNCGCMCETEYEYSYVNPMYDMTPMQYMGNMSNQYMTMETPYIMPFDDGDSMNDMWNNYYMYIQKMIQSMND